MNNAVLKGLIKTSIMKEALSSCQMEGIGEDMTIKDLYLAELKNKLKGKKKEGGGE